MEKGLEKDMEEKGSKEKDTEEKDLKEREIWGKEFPGHPSMESVTIARDRGTQYGIVRTLERDSKVHAMDAQS